MPKNTFVNIEKYRDGKGYINLVEAFEDIYTIDTNIKYSRVNTYLTNIMRISPIKSRQVAATALATARTMIG